VVPDWNDLVADLASSGAGGLDTGAEAAQAWYVPWAIRKRSDGTKALILQRAPVLGADALFLTANDASRALRLATGTATDALAQGFQVTTVGLSGPIDRIDAKMSRTGSVSGNVWFTIEADSSGNPSGTPLATSDKINVATLGTTAHWLHAIFRTPFTPSLSTQYHLVLQGDYTRSDTVFVSWVGVAAGGYANGSAKQFNGAAWSAASGVGDFNFRVHTRIFDVPLTLPSGYDQKAKLPLYVRNNGSSNFLPCVAVDKTVSLLSASQLASGVTATGAGIQQDNALLVAPPVPCVLSCTVHNATDGAGVVVGGGHHGWDVAGSGSSSVAFSAAANAQSHVGGVITEHHTVYVWVTGGTGTVILRGFTIG
jgi:hypothetical protein